MISLCVTGHLALALINAALVLKSVDGEESHGWNLFSGVGSSGEGGGSKPKTFLTKFAIGLVEVFEQAKDLEKWPWFFITAENNMVTIDGLIGCIGNW